jgi:pseudouridine-5'-phosphate glycosidase
LADQQKIRGRDVTPFVLSQVNLLTSGASLTASKRILYIFFYSGSYVSTVEDR